MSDLDIKYNIVDGKTPQNVPLSAKYKKSFAYYTIQERLPIIITKIIDQMTRDKDELMEYFNGEQTKEDLKEVIANISELKYELQTNKEFIPLDGDEVDKDVWNTFIGTLGENNTYFSAKWLYAETYLYRRLKSIFEKTKSLKEFDCFRKQKDYAFTKSKSAINMVLQHTADFYSKHPTSDASVLGQLEEFFYKLLRVNLWGNRCDLSISNGREVAQTGNPFEALPSYESSILADDSRKIWDCLKSGSKSCTIDFILDNAGYEIFGDFVLADFILRYNFANKVRFHCKAIPWFISDVVYRDFHWSIRQLVNSDVEVLVSFGQRLQQYVDSGRLELRPTEFFWTSPYEFQAMQKIAPKLYADLATSHLLIFKGDLNYRKLLADMNWPYSSKFTDVLGVFRPTNLCTLRTVKADLICEIPDGIEEELSKIDPMWMETGQYGVMHFASKI